jgi:hypothetical protein
MQHHPALQKLAMSQHVLRTTAGNGDAVTVTLGYDRPLNYVFCLVEDQRGDYPYSNLADLHAGTHQQDVEYFRRILAKLGIEVPEQMFAEVEADRANRVGNRTVDHTK